MSAAYPRARPLQDYNMLRWRLFRIDFCIQPSFWIMNALFAFMLNHFYPGMRGNIPLLYYILIWIFCTLVCILAHELGHVVTGRIFGQPGNITVTGIGGQAVGAYDELAPWQRILVISAGPAAGFVFLAMVVVFDASTSRWNLIMDHFDWQKLKLDWFLVDQIDPILRMGGSDSYALAISLLVMINLFVNLLNLLPIIPMDGGMIFKEVCGLIAGKSGERFAFGISFLLAAMLTLYFLAVVLVKYNILPQIELYYPFVFPEISLVVFGMMAYQCFQAYRQIGVMQRHSLYSDND
jgi:Zn-dependent protease